MPPAPASPAERSRDELVQPGMELVVGGEHLALRQPRLGAPEIADEAASLADQQDAGGDVPEIQVLFPEAVEAAGRDPGEIERRGAVAADAGDFGRDSLEYPVEPA